MTGDNYAGFAAAVFMGFFSIVNPIANVPVFLDLTGYMTPEQRRKIAFKAVAVAFIIITVFSLAGNTIFRLLNISLPALRITGGVLLFIVGYGMILGDGNRKMPQNTVPVSDPGISAAVTPLAMPLMAGPGTITTAMNYAAAHDPVRTLIVIGVYGLICYIAYLLFLSGGQIMRWLGANTMLVITKMMGLILAVLGVQMLLEGINEGLNLRR
ncbi:MarC family protein [Chitinophaga lutea]